MLISKYTDKNGKVNVNIIVHNNFIQPTNNPDYKRISLSSDFLVGLDEKKSATVDKIFNLDVLKDNTKNAKKSSKK